jgi:hypothetical protein
MEKCNGYFSGAIWRKYQMGNIFYVKYLQSGINLKYPSYFERKFETKYFFGE